MALVVIGEMTLTDLAQHFDVHANQVATWKARVLEGAVGLFGSAAATGPVTAAVDPKSLHAKLGELTLEDGFGLGHRYHEHPDGARLSFIWRP